MVTELLALVGLGFFIQGISLFLRPARKIMQKTDLLWDVVGAVSPRFFTLIIAAAIAAPLRNRLADFHWITSTRGLIMSAPLWMLVLMYIVLVDLLDYWMHRLLHASWFWHQHAWHHSPKVIYWISGLRTSPGQIVIRIIPATIFAAFISFNDFINLGVFFLIFFTLSQHFIHSNRRIPCEKYIELICVTPRYHMVHHSVDRNYSDSNFAQIFVWDKLFGTFTDPASVPVDAPSGLNYENTNLRLLFGLPPARSEDAKAAFDENIESAKKEGVSI